jgi:hypothetical protein
VITTAMERMAIVTPAYIKVHDRLGRNKFVASRSGTATLDRARAIACCSVSASNTLSTRIAIGIRM